MLIGVRKIFVLISVKEFGGLGFYCYLCIPFVNGLGIDAVIINQ